MSQIGITKCIYAGSFDPITNGHLWMIEQGARLFDQLVVAIGTNESKESFFSIKDKKDMICSATSHLGNIIIDDFQDSFLINFANEISATYILRGIRNTNDYEYERSIRLINSDINNEITTVFLMPPREVAEISSSIVKRLVGPEGWQDVVRKYVPEQVLVMLEKNQG